MDEITKIKKLVQAANARWGNDNPFQIVTRLTEELGEIASEVNAIEGSGIKHQKVGSERHDELAKECVDALRGIYSLISHYDLGDAVERSLSKTYESWKAEGFIFD